jgi:hypothetical protein
MTILNSYSNGIIDALEKVAAGITMGQVQDHLGYNKIAAMTTQLRPEIRQRLMSGEGIQLLPEHLHEVEEGSDADAFAPQNAGKFQNMLDNAGKPPTNTSSGMTMDQAREYLKVKDFEAGQDALASAGTGVGSGFTVGLLNSIPATSGLSPISGKALILPAAAAGLAASKLKSVVDSPKHMYIRGGELTGRSIGGLAGGGIGAGVGAGVGHLIDNSGWGMGLGGLLGGLLGQGAGQIAGDYATERSNADVIRKAKIERAKQLHTQNK